MTKLKPHEIFRNLFIKYCDDCRTLDYVKRNEEDIKERFYHYVGVEWPDDVSVVDCFNKVTVDEKLR